MSPSGHDGPEEMTPGTLALGGAEQTWVGDEEASAEVLAERYIVQAELGRGAIGVVERVFDAHLNRTVARKRLLDDRPASRKRFIREARITASLAHPGIAPVFDLGVDGTEVPYYTMQEIVGQPWRRFVEDALDLQARLGQLDVLLAVARAVAHAHEHELVHRDVKLDNVMIGPLGDVFLVDWGIAVPVGHHGPPAGTPQYMSPEQARGEPANKGSDVWALGVLLFRLLAGQAPYRGPSGAEVLEQAKAGAVPDVGVLAPDAPAELVDMVRKATALDPGDRYPDASAFAADLRAFLQGNWVTAHRYSVRELVERLWERHRVQLLVGVASTTLLALLLASTFYAIQQERDRAVAAEALAIQQLAAELEARAAAMSTDRWEPMAELTAARSLAIDPDRPVAWGVLMRHARADHPRLAWHAATPCPAVAIDEHTLVVDCAGTARVADVAAERVGPFRDAPLAPVATGAARVDYLVAGRLLAQGLPGRTVIVDVDTGQVVLEVTAENSYSPPIATTVRAGQPGILARGRSGVLSWAAGGEATELGTAGPARGVAADGDHLYAQRMNGRVLHCMGTPVECSPAIDADDVHLTAAGHGWLVASHARGGLTIARAPEDEQDPATTERTKVPTDAGVYRGLHVAGGVIAGLRTDGDVDVWGTDGTPIARLPTRSIRATGLGSHQGHLVVLGDGVQAWSLGGRRRSRVPSDAITVTDRSGEAVTAALGEVRVHGEPPLDGPIPRDVVKDMDTLPDGRITWSVIRGPIDTWDPRTGQTTSYRHPASARRLVGMANGDVLFVDYARRIWRLGPSGPPTQAEGACWGDLARSEDRRTVVCGEENRLHRLDPTTGDVVEQLAEADRALWAVGVSPDGRYVLYAQEDHTLVRIDRTTGETTRHPSHHDGHIPAIAYSPDGRYVATGSWDHDVHLFDAEDMTLLAVLSGHRGRVLDVHFVGNQELASVGWDATLWRWDLSVLGTPPRAHLDRLSREVGIVAGRTN